MAKEASKPFKFVGGHLCLDFNNTVDWVGPDPCEGEYLSDYRRLVAWAGEAGVLAPGAMEPLLDQWTANPALGEAALGRARSARTTIHRVFWGIIAGGPPLQSELEQLNSLLREAPADLEYDSHHKCCVWSWSSQNRDLTNPIWPVIWSAAELLTAAELANVKACANDTCGWLFLDTSRKHNRKWCEMGVCGNRAKARRFYDRRKRRAQGS
ncbi:MAG: ABATE domain-containing protein [Gemmatimonadota bacterium]|nr:MAG: ABATE domain-containing protein [Gemmatimonadota bacterium]